MAKRYALVPESWLSNLHGPNQKQEAETSQNSTVATNFLPKKSSLIHFAELLPKNLRNRARMVLQYLENGNATVNDVQRVVYDDGNVGSHIVDLTRYAISPFMKTRPVDWPQFRNLLEKLNIPSSAIVNRDTTESPLSRWKPY